MAIIRASRVDYNLTLASNLLTSLKSQKKPIA